MKRNAGRPTTRRATLCAPFPTGRRSARQSVDHSARRGGGVTWSQPDEDKIDLCQSEMMANLIMRWAAGRPTA